MADTILLIHGDADVLGTVGDYLDRLGCEVGRAATAQAGFEAFERTRPDVVILDLHLPDQSGLEALERLRARGGGWSSCSPGREIRRRASEPCRWARSIS